MLNFSAKDQIISAAEALPGRDEPLSISAVHAVSGHSMTAPFPEGIRWILLGLGCFWGAERRFWQQPWVHVTAVGYSGGFTKNPTYDEVCSGLTGHTEVVLVAYQDQSTLLEQLLALFWESHDPTQGMRQGNDRGSQYRSAIYCVDDQQLEAAQQSREQYQRQLTGRDFPTITTDIALVDAFYYAEEYHQQYLAKNPQGYCGLAGTGIPFLDHP